MMDIYISNNLLGYNDKYSGINSIKEDDNYYYVSFNPNHPEETSMFVHRFNKETMQREDLTTEQAGFDFDIAKTYPIPYQYESKHQFEQYLEKKR